ncbi:MAG: hypothetical protein QOK43_1117 [Acidimicrobiaceae bacterium]|nr:hypothetical protein [Acidimicrobiaceae bacterium]
MFIRRIYTSCLVALVGLLTLATPAAAAEGAPTSTTTTVPPADQLGPIITHLRLWLAGLLGIGATLMLTVAGWLYMTAGGSTTQIEKAKTAFRSALVGYALAALAPILVGVLKGLTA